MAGAAGLEPTIAPWDATWVHAQKKTQLSLNVAGAAGLEPTTRGFGDRCSTN